MLILLFFIILILVISLFFLKKSGENFGIPLESSTAWGPNVSTQYEAGDTGFAMVGKWPGDIPDEPWKWWMWKRRPQTFVNPFIPSPQIDYNYSDTFGNWTSQYNVTCIENTFAIDGIPNKTLQIDKGRIYWFNVYSPGKQFVLTDGENELNTPVEVGNFSITFGDDLPDQIYYGQPGNPTGIIYLNHIGHQ